MARIRWWRYPGLIVVFFILSATALLLTLTLIGWRFLVVFKRVVTIQLRDGSIILWCR
jgi:hypothetical protein